MGWKSEVKRLQANDLERNIILESKGGFCKDVLVVCVHNKEHWRDNTSKYAEPETEILAKELYIKNDCWVIYKKSSDYEDGNRDETCSIKNDINKILKKHKEIKLVIFLHQLARDRKTDIDLGTFNCDAWKTINLFRKWSRWNELQCTLDKYFMGTGENHLGDYIKTNFKHIDCLQIEINSKLVYKEGSKDTFNYIDSERVFKMLNQAIYEYSKKRKGD